MLSGDGRDVSEVLFVFPLFLPGPVPGCPWLSLAEAVPAWSHFLQNNLTEL